MEAQLKDENLIIKRYTVRKTGKREASFEVTIPKEAFEREARRFNLTVDEAVKRLGAVWKFNNFPGLHLSFELRKGES